MKSTREQMAASKAQGVRDTAAGSSSVVRPLSETLDLRIFCGTWNVAGLMLDEYKDIAEWLDCKLVDGHGQGASPPDMFVLGFQEVVLLSAQNVVLDSLLDTQSRANSLKWIVAVYQYLTEFGQKHGVRYMLVSEQRLLGTYIIIMGSTALCPRLRHVQSAAIPTGLGGLLGTKGAVAVRMEVNGSASLCFVCVHMAAHREYIEARNSQFRFISSRQVFAATNASSMPQRTYDKGTGGWGGLFSTVGEGWTSPSRRAEVKQAIKAAMDRSRCHAERGYDSFAESREGSTGSFKEGPIGDVNDIIWVSREDCSGFVNGLPNTKTVLQADIVVWLGDLNYRIAEGVLDADVFRFVNEDKLEKLREMDQLNIERAAGRVFEDFQEGPLCFPPSYKYIPGTRELDNRFEKKLRCPSWCDRILYLVGINGGESVRRLGLERYWTSGPLLSDHMPVSALFRATLACAKKTLPKPKTDFDPLS